MKPVARAQKKLSTDYHEGNLWISVLFFGTRGGLVCLLNDCPNREGDFDAFLAESGGQGFDEFVFEPELVIKAGRMQEYVEVDAAFTKVVETDGRLAVSVQFFIEFL